MLDAHCRQFQAVAAAVAAHPHLHTLRLAISAPPCPATGGTAWPAGALSSIPSLHSLQLRGLLPPGRAGQGMVEDLAGCSALRVLELAAPGERPLAEQLEQPYDGVPSKACGSGSGRGGAAIPGWAFQRLVAGASAGRLRRLVLGRAWAAAARSGCWRGGEEVRLTDVGQALGGGALPMLESCSVAVKRQHGWQGQRSGCGAGPHSRLPPCGGAARGGDGGCWAQAEAQGAQGQASRVRLALGAMQHVLYCPEEMVLLLASSSSSSREACQY